MGELKSSIILDLQGNMERQAERFSGSLGRLGSRGSRQMQILGRSMTAVGNGLDRLGNRYSALLTGAAGVGTLKMVADHSEKLTRLGIDAGVAAEGIHQLGQKIMDTARMPDIRLNPDELLAAVAEVVNSTGDLAFAERNLRNFGVVIRATGASGKDIGAMATELQKLDKNASPENVLKAFDVFIEQGKAGAVAMRDLASVGPKVFSAYASARSGADPATFVRELGAAMQSIKSGTGSVDEAATAMDALMRAFEDKDRLKGFKAAGIDIYNPEKLKQNIKDLRPINVLMAEIYEKTKNSPTALSELIPEAEARRAIMAKNLSENLKKYYEVESDGTAVVKDSARAAQEMNAVLTSLSTTWKDLANRKLSGPLRDIADAMGSMKPETVDNWANGGVAVASVVGALVVARKLQQGGRAVIDMFGKGGAGNKLAGVSKFGDAIPVYVVNGPASIWPGAGGLAAGGLAAEGAATASVLAVVAPLIPVVATATVGYLSQKTGKALAESEVKHTPSADLRKLYSEQMVKGGGSESYQAKLILNELIRRGEATPAQKDEGAFAPAGELWARKAHGAVIIESAPGAFPKPVIPFTSHTTVPSSTKRPITPITPITPSAATQPKQNLATKLTTATPNPSPIAPAESLASKLSRSPANRAQIYDKTNPPAAKPVEVGGSLKIEITTQPGTTAKVRDMRSQNLNLDVDSGIIMAGN